jgi:hypothetical protein
VCSGGGSTRCGLLLEESDERGGSAEWVGDCPAITVDADGRPDISGDLGHQHTAAQRALGVVGGKPPQRHLVIGIREADGEAHPVIERSRMPNERWLVEDIV